MIITRNQAITEQRTRYFTGIPCRHGHVCERYTTTSGCIECLRPKIVKPTVTADPFTVAMFEAQRIESLARIEAARLQRIADLEAAAKLKGDARNAALERNRRLRMLMPLNVFLHHEDVDGFLTYLQAVNAQLIPDITLVELSTNRRPSPHDGDVSKYHFLCSPSLIVEARAFAASMCASNDD